MFCHWTILDSVIIYIVSIQNELEVKDTTDAQKSASYLDLLLEIDNGGRLKAKLYDKHDDLTFPIVNYPFISSNIPTSPAYGVYISQLARFYRACAKYSVDWFSGQSSAADIKATQTSLRCS